MLSVGLVGTWVYHLYDKSVYTTHQKKIFIKDSAAVAQGVQDSLERIYFQTINSLGTELDSTKNTAGQLKGELNSKLTEIYRLRSEISTILKKNNVRKEDLDMARKKTAELQQLVTELQNKNSTIEEEKRQIAAAFDQVNDQVKELEGNMQVLSQENKVLTEKVRLASTFMASDLKISPVMVKNDKEVETNVANKASKFVVSFDVRNNMAQYDNAEVFVVIRQPDGKVLNTDIWESYSMDTNDGRKLDYTRKVKFEYQKGETKHLLFSINPDDYQKGNYSLQVYHNGYKIGETAKILN
jgi:predicted RNase H-like nuclease (RuvC/YqgF family)